MTLAILCSGQGTQHRDMFALTGNAPQAESLFTQANTLLGCDAREMVRNESTDALRGNRTAQILCSLQAVTAAAALSDALPHRLIIAGYSVGELAAWGFAGTFGPIDTLGLTARRAELMDAAACSNEGMLFVRGLARAAIQMLCERHGAAVAIVNPGDAFVLGGDRLRLAALARDARAMKASRVVDVPVKIASHTPHLAGAAFEFRELLHGIHVSPLSGSRRLLSGVDGTPVLDIETGCDKLAAQISETVQWQSCLQACIEAGATAFLELGPGSALCRMASDVYRDVPARSLEEFKTLQGARDWLTQRDRLCDL